MSNTVVKEKKVKKTLMEKGKEIASLVLDSSLEIDHASPVPVVEKKAKVPRKVSLKRLNL